MKSFAYHVTKLQTAIEEIHNRKLFRFEESNSGGLSYRGIKRNWDDTEMENQKFKVAIYQV